MKIGQNQEFKDQLEGYYISIPTALLLIYMLINILSYSAKFFFMFIFFLYIWYYDGFKAQQDDEGLLKSFYVPDTGTADVEKTNDTERRGTKHQLKNLTMDI